MLVLPTRAARDKQETDENNSAGSRAVSRVEKKPEPSPLGRSPCGSPAVLRPAPPPDSARPGSARPSGLVLPVLRHPLWLPTALRMTSRVPLPDVRSAFSVTQSTHQGHATPRPPNAAPPCVSEAERLTLPSPRGLSLRPRPTPTPPSKPRSPPCPPPLSSRPQSLPRACLGPGPTGTSVSGSAFRRPRRPYWPSPSCRTHSLSFSRPSAKRATSASSWEMSSTASG